MALLTAAFSVVGMAALPTAAHAAPGVVEQCNGHGPRAQGATTAMTCTVTVVNTIRGSTRGSTTTVTRHCTLGPCEAPNGTFTTSSASLVTDIRQCNSSDNDAAHAITCNVYVTNDISRNTPHAQPFTFARVSQCVGSAQGGGGVTDCRPATSPTTDATVTQCNGSGNGGGGAVHCTVAGTASATQAIPISVHQCNGTGNPGGSVLRCRVGIVTNITGTPAPVATPTAARTATPTQTQTQSSTGAPSATAVPSPASAALPGKAPAATGSTGLPYAALLTATATLVLVAALGTLWLRRSARQEIAGLFRRFARRH